MPHSNRRRSSKTTAAGDNDDLSSTSQGQGVGGGTVAADLMSGEFIALLPPDFAPTKWDVICQRGKECFEHGTCVFVCH